MKDLNKLIELFRAAGAPDPGVWAASEAQEGIPQLARYLFLRGAWNAIVPDGDTSWMDAARKENRKADAPCGALGPALDRMIAKGIDPIDLADVVRIMQYEVLFSICYLLDDPGAALQGIENPPPELERVGWVLIEAVEDGGGGRHIGGLHESALETDPTGREMRPRR